jgi:tRNA dimethylallyltransferase
VRHAALVGTTASGKSALALELARRDPTIELVSVDSMQVYRGMDIGTAKPTPAERAEVPHHLLDVADPDEEFTVARFQCLVRDAIADIEARGRRALLVGGTGLYLRAVIDDLDIPGRYPDVRAEIEAEPDTEALHRRLAELDPRAATRMEPGNRRIAERFERMLADGFVEEVRTLAARPLSKTARQALGYRELLRHVEEGAPLEECVEEAVRRTRQFARRQEAWFRRDPRITWIDVDDLQIGAVGDEVLGDWDHRCRP